MAANLKNRLQFEACELARPLLRRLPAGRVRVLGWLGGGQSSRTWAEHPHPQRIFWDGDLKAWIEVDLADWGGRWHYFSGIYYDQLLPWIMQRYLREGDTFIDVGANFGIHSLRAARLVGASGRVWALEPSPLALRRLRLHLLLNRVENVEVLPVAMAAVESERVLRIDGSHLGTASLREAFAGTDAIPVRTRTLDSAVAQPEPRRRALIKIDVEGLELAVVRGASTWLERRNTAFVVEVTPDWIESTGAESADLFREFLVRRYQAFRIARGGRAWNAPPVFVAADKPAPGQADYLFVRQDELRSFPWFGEQVDRPT